MAEATLTATAKKCPRCDTTKSLADFYKNKRDGYAPYCKPCSAAYKRKGSKTRSELRAETYPVSGAKRCSKCAEVRPLSEFNEKRSGQPRPSCKTCQSAQFLSWYASNHVSRATGKSRAEMATEAAARRWDITETRRTCSVCSERKPLEDFKRRRAYCIACRSVKEAGMYARRKEVAAVKRAEYRDKNKDRCREYARQGQQRRRARKEQVDATLTQAEWAAILLKYGNRCLCCGVHGKMTMDHVIPISRGGSHTAENVQPLCGPCNSKKHAKTIDYRLAA